MKGGLVKSITVFFIRRTTFCWSRLHMKGSVCFSVSLSQYFLATVSSQLKHGVRIFFKKWHYKDGLRKQSHQCDSYYINILTAEMDGIVLWLRWKIQIAFALRAARRSATKVLSFSRIGLHLVPWLAEMH